MRTTAASLILLLGLASACGDDEPLPAMPEPAQAADSSGGEDLDSLGAEDEAPAEPAEGE